MTDNTKSLASLADELDGPRFGRLLIAADDSDYGVSLASRAAAALRAPTIAAEERCESCRKVLGRGWKYDSTGDVKLCLACYTALATPSPTIAAPSPSQSNTLDLPPCPVCGETLVTRYSGPLPGCPQGISTAVCPTNPSHASQPPQASPSNEVTAEMVEGFNRFVRVVLKESCWPAITVRRAIEAALRARKPADDGAGQ